MGTTIIGLRIKSLVVISNLQFNSQYDQFQNFHNFGMITNVEEGEIFSYESMLAFFALLVTMSVLRILKFLRIPPSTGPASSAIFDTLRDRSFAVFVLIYLIVLISFMFTFQLVRKLLEI